MISPVQILCLPLHDGFTLLTVSPRKLILHVVVSLSYLVTEVMIKGKSTTNTSPQHLSAHISGAKLSHTGNLRSVWVSTILCPMGKERRHDRLGTSAECSNPGAALVADVLLFERLSSWCHLRICPSRRMKNYLL